MPKNNKAADWEYAERLCRLAQMSPSEIGRIIGRSPGSVIRHMKRRGIHCDLKEEVQRRTQEAVANLHVTTDQDERDITEAVNTNIALVMSHRKDLQKLRALENKFYKELRDNPTKLYLANYLGNVIEKEIGLTVSEKLAALANYAKVQAQRIEKERQAFGMKGDDGDYDESNNKKMVLNINVRKK